MRFGAPHFARCQNRPADSDRLKPTLRMVAKIQVLLATYNGRQWLDEQLDSILGQTGVDVQVLVSDDASTDGTAELLSARAQRDPRIVVSRHQLRFGSAAANFYHLLAQADTAGHEFFALADQDDIWASDKLYRHLRLLQGTAASGISSDVTAFWPNGRTRLIKKSQPQRRWDHLLEPPGPGCTFLMTRELVVTVAHWIYELTAAGVGPLSKHDWFIYLVARCSGKTWHIDPNSTVRYRQHTSNEVGANAGLSAKLKRVSILIRGGYQMQVRHAIQIARLIAVRTNQNCPPEQFPPLMLVRHGRRRPYEAWLVALFSIGRL